MIKHIYLVFSVIAILFSSSLNALQIDKHPVDALATVTTPGSNGATNKHIKLINFTLTQQELNRITKINNVPINISVTNSLPQKVQLGMNQVPVLDQGAHGTCVTFAQTAALDALIGKGDYVSQLCTLELATYLAEDGYVMSGWNGTLAPLVLDHLARFGYVNIANQRAGKCAGVKEYPIDDESDEGKSFPLTEFNKVHENLLFKDVNFTQARWVWTPILNMWDRLSKHYREYKDIDSAKRALTEIKASLANHNRVTFGVLMFNSGTCRVIACATHKKTNDTWAVIPSIISDPKFQGGHEMVITGYDDQAIAKDAEGKTHYGLLTLRNSWGADVGDNGDYYMSYEYFIRFVGEAQRIVDFKS